MQFTFKILLHKRAVTHDTMYFLFKKQYFTLNDKLFISYFYFFRASSTCWQAVLSLREHYFSLVGFNIRDSTLEKQ